MTEGRIEKGVKMNSERTNEISKPVTPTHLNDIDPENFTCTEFTSAKRN